MDKSIWVYLRSWGSSALSVGAGPEHIAFSRKCRPWLFPWYPQTESISHKSLPNKAVHQGAKAHINLYLYNETRFILKRGRCGSTEAENACFIRHLKGDCPPCVYNCICSHRSFNVCLSLSPNDPAIISRFKKKKKKNEEHSLSVIA